jgi:hypothetical protein
VTTPPASRRVWTAQQVAALGLTCDITTAAAVLGIGRTLAFQLLREGRFPVRVLRLGRAARVPVADLLILLTAAPTQTTHTGTVGGHQVPSPLTSTADAPAAGAHGVRHGRDRPLGQPCVLPARGGREDAWTG